jgi:hypothetical protein
MAPSEEEIDTVKSNHASDPLAGSIINMEICRSRFFMHR